MFTLVSTTDFPARKMTAKLFRHECGLQVLSMEADDPENLFVLCLPTDPVDDTGTPHIIEHSVLEGSERFPVKDPFVCLLKSSVATFLNAVTYPDRTLYPFTSCCSKDYFNLLEVYWDAVFHPRLSREILAQEGWHYEIHGKGEKKRLSINGIVHNEMSGYYSDPGTVLGRMLEKTLFPHTSLRYDSGGVPEKISSLTYSKFIDFHKKHYNPFVAKIILFGNIPTEEKLAVIEEHLKKDLPRLEKNAVISKDAVPTHAVPNAPTVRRAPFVPDPEALRTKKGIAAIAWALDDTRDPELDLGFQLLEAVLIGNLASPLSKALIESRIGSSPMASGYDNETKYTSFCVGMRGVKPTDFKKYESLVMDTLRKCVKDGIPKAQVQGALTRFQAANLNINKDYVIELLDDILASWHYSDDPFLFLRQSEQLPKLQELLDKNPRYLEDLIQKWLLDNPRRVRLELRPDATLKQRQDKILADKMAKKFATWSQAKKAKTEVYQKRLQQIATTPDTPEALATIPVLRREDLPSAPTRLNYEDGRFANGLKFRKSTDFANGLSRLNLTFDASDLPTDLLDYLQFFLILFPKMGTIDKSYDVRAEEWGLNGSEFQMSANIGTPRVSPTPFYTIPLSICALDRKLPQALDLFTEQLHNVSFREHKHIVNLLKSAATRQSAQLLSRSNFTYASSRAASGLNEMHTFVDRLTGFYSYGLCQSTGRLGENQLDELIDKMERIAGWLKNATLVAAGIATDDSDAFQAMEKFSSNWTARDSINSADGLIASIPPCTLAPGRAEYALIQAQVHTCVRAFSAPHESSKDRNPLMIAANILSSGYLWDEIRAKGGAYGCTMKYRPLESVAFLHSHDDPNCENTFRAFDAIPEFLKKNPFTQEEIDKAVLQALGSMLTPVRPASAATRCCESLQAGIDNNLLCQRFEELQKIKRKQVQDAAERFFAQSHNDCALGPAPIPQNMSRIDF